MKISLLLRLSVNVIISNRLAYVQLSGYYPSDTHAVTYTRM